ncbi:MAG TPA: carboxypeptidase-like regulatory domain-containing protein [Burkholderiaceae bacterium]|nr:carboxypeptidase-like regulatory domain-containing protein [Burkholderiaceae bacterium]
MAIAAGAFLAALAVLALMLYQAERLVRLGLVGNLYYFLLVPLGLAAAVFLFGVLRSYAVYVGKIEGGSIELGGPIVAFLLVVVLGFKLIPNPQPFGLTIFVHGERGRQDVIVRNAGSVLLDLGGDRRRESIGDKGQAYFAGIPSNFRGQSISVAVDVQGYETAVPNDAVKIEGDSAYVAIRPKAVELTGYVRTETGQPVVGATVSVSGVSSQTDASGFFKMTLPGAAPRQSMAMQVTATGFAAWNSQVVPGANEIAIVLDRSK